MKNSFDSLIRSADAAKNDFDLIQNHINCGVPKRIENMINDIIMMIDTIEDDEVFLARLISEKQQLESALGVYVVSDQE